MGKLSGFELKRARLVPSAVFASPGDVVRAADLSRAEKIAILRRWEFDARPPAEQTSVRQDGPILDQIRRALISLEAAGPTTTLGVATRH